MTDRDQRYARTAARRVAFVVGLSAATVLGIVGLIIVATMLSSSRVAPTPPGEHSGPDNRWEDRVLDLGGILPLVIALVLVGVGVLACVAWYASRRAAEPMEHALRVQREFVADASHELRTPLTTLNSRLQLAEHRLERGGDVAGALAEARRDASALDDVLTDLLQAAEFAGGPPPVGAHCIVWQAAVQASETIRPQAEERQVALSLQIPSSLAAAAESKAMTRALTALLDNAVRHSPRGGAVLVAGHIEGGWAAVRVSDQGGGVPEGEREEIFRRFHRQDGAQTPRRGFGLGLALVRGIAERFGGDVAVERTGSTGSTFLLRLPRAD